MIGLFFPLSFCFENMMIINYHLIMNLMDDYRKWLPSLHKADIDSFNQMGFLHSLKSLLQFFLLWAGSWFISEMSSPD